MMSRLADSVYSWADLLRIWNELEVPEGWRSEITPEGIVMTPPPSGTHNLIADIVHRALATSTDDSFALLQTQGVAIPAIGAVFIPDLCVVPRAAVPPGSEPVDAQHVVLAVEITSRSNAAHDLKRKRWAYAHGPIPQYLLIDAFDDDGPMISLFSYPVDGIYRNTAGTPFGQKVALGTPLEVVLDTALFPS